MHPRVDRLEGVRRLGKAAVVQARSVSEPLHRAELRPFQAVGQVPARAHVANAPREPVRAALGGRPGDVATVGAGDPSGERGRAVRRQRVGVDEHGAGIAPGRGREEHGLRLDPVAGSPENTCTRRRGHPDVGLLQEFGHLRLALGVRGQCLQEFAGQHLLGIDPRGGARIGGVLEPAVGIRDRCIPIGVHVIGALGGRVGPRRGRQGGCGRGDAPDHGEQDSGENPCAVATGAQHGPILPVPRPSMPPGDQELAVLRGGPPRPTFPCTPAMASSSGSGAS